MDLMRILRKGISKIHPRVLYNNPVPIISIVLVIIILSKTFVRSHQILYFDLSTQHFSILFFLMLHFFSLFPFSYSNFSLPRIIWLRGSFKPTHTLLLHYRQHACFVHEFACKCTHMLIL